MATMEALKFSFKNRTLEHARVEVPKIIHPNDVLIKVAFAGICGTDLHILAGDFPCRQTMDLTLGHEISGTIAEVGDNVIFFQEGDRVAVDPNRGCKRCTFCHAGKPHFCKIGCSAETIGFYKNGGWAQFVLVPEEQVYKVPLKITLEQAVLTEPMSCLIHAFDILNPISVGVSILILGAGIVGALWASALHLQGHRKVTISEPVEPKLDFVRKLNTGYKLTTPERLKKDSHFNPESVIFDVVIDCSGTPEAIEQGISVLNSGGKLCVFGVAPETAKIQISPFDIYWKEIKIIGSKINPFCFEKALGLIEAMGNRYLNYSVLGVKTFQLKDFKEALDTIKKGNCVKAIFRIL